MGLGASRITPGRRPGSRKCSSIRNTGLLIGLHHHNANQGEKFEESHTGLDHISFQVADRAALKAWIDRLDELNIGHTGIRRLAERAVRHRGVPRPR